MKNISINLEKMEENFPTFVFDFRDIISYDIKNIKKSTEINSIIELIRPPISKFVRLVVLEPIFTAFKYFKNEKPFLNNNFIVTNDFIDEIENKISSYEFFKKYTLPLDFKISILMENSSFSPYNLLIDKNKKFNSIKTHNTINYDISNLKNVNSNYSIFESCARYLIFVQFTNWNIFSDEFKEILKKLQFIAYEAGSPYFFNCEHTIKKNIYFHRNYFFNNINELNLLFNEYCNNDIVFKYNYNLSYYKGATKELENQFKKESAYYKSIYLNENATKVFGSDFIYQKSLVLGNTTNRTNIINIDELPYCFFTLYPFMYFTEINNKIKFDNIPVDFYEKNFNEYINLNIKKILTNNSLASFAISVK